MILCVYFTCCAFPELWFCYNVHSFAWNKEFVTWRKMCITLFNHRWICDDYNLKSHYEVPYKLEDVIFTMQKYLFWSLSQPLLQTLPWHREKGHIVWLWRTCPPLLPMPVALQMSTAQAQNCCWCSVCGVDQQWKWDLASEVWPDDLPPGLGTVYCAEHSSCLPWSDATVCTGRGLERKSSPGNGKIQNM